MTAAWLDVARGDAPLLVSLPHTGTDIPADIEPRLVSPWLRARTPTGGSTGSTTSRASSARPSSAPRISRTVIDVNRDPSGASLYPGQATTELCPTDTFDGEPLYRAGAGAGRGRDRAAPRRLLRPLSRGARRRDRAPARHASARRALRLPFDPLGHPAAVRRRAAACQHRHQRRRDLRSATRRAHRRASPAPAGFSARRQRPLQGRLDHPPLRPAGRAASTPCRWSSPAAATCASRSARSTKATGRRRTTAAYAAPHARHALRAILEACLALRRRTAKRGPA